MIEQWFESASSTLTVSNQDLFDIVFSLGLSLAIALIISQIYKVTHRGLNFELSFMATLVLLAPIVTVVMLFIRGDLVLSLGLIGSLSIIRFRTPIKDTRDMVFLFWVIATGLGCGTFNWVTVTVSAFIIGFVIFILHLIRYGQTASVDYVLVVSGDRPVDKKKLLEAIRKNCKELRVRSKETEGTHWENVYEIRFQQAEPQAEALLGDLDRFEGVKKTSLLAPQIAMPV